jgi:hypothetical protein
MIRFSTIRDKSPFLLMFCLSKSSAILLILITSFTLSSFMLLVFFAVMWILCIFMRCSARGLLIRDFRFVRVCVVQRFRVYLSWMNPCVSLLVACLGFVFGLFLRNVRRRLKAFDTLCVFKSSLDCSVVFARVIYVARVGGLKKKRVV